MRITIPILAALGLLGCWADFPPELLRADARRDLGDARPDRPADLRPDQGADRSLDRALERADRSLDQRADRPLDQRADQPADRAREASADARVWLPLGATCTSAAECASNHCDPRSQVCCNASCSAPCMSCGIAGALGRCGFVPPGLDPHDDCKTVDPVATCKLDGTCDGSGGCRAYPGGTLVTPASCTGSMSERVTLATLCDGLGGTTPTAEIDCTPYSCDPAIKRCHESCSAPSHCVTGACVSSRCNGQERPAGAACKKGQDCASSSCVDGYCCEGSCAKECERCDLPGREGKCLPVFAGTDPDNNCPKTGAACSGQEGSCDGKGACRSWPQGAPCAGASCSGSSLTLFGTCAASACVPSTASCGSYACLPSGDGCYAFCSADAHCKPGCSCNTVSWSCEGSC